MKQSFLVIATALCLTAHAKRPAPQEKVGLSPQEKMHLAYEGCHEDRVLFPTQNWRMLLDWLGISIPLHVEKGTVISARDEFLTREHILVKLEKERGEYLAKRHSTYRKYQDMKKELRQFEEKYHAELAAAQKNDYLLKRIYDAQRETAEAYWDYFAKRKVFEETPYGQELVISNDKN